MRVSLWLAVLVVASVGAQATAQPADLAQDPLLQKRLTVWLKMEPLRDALRTIGKQTGVALRCQDAIADEKVAVFVFLTPTGERKYYVFYLRSVEPSRLLERAPAAAPKPSEGGESR